MKMKSCPVKKKRMPLEKNQHVNTALFIGNDFNETVLASCEEGREGCWETGQGNVKHNTNTRRCWGEEMV